MIQELTIKFGKGDIVVCYNPVGLQFMECTKSFPLGKRVTDEDFETYCSGRGVIIDFTDTNKIHEFYSCICCVSRNCPRFVFDNITFDFGSKPNKKSIENIKESVKIWIEKKIEHLTLLTEDKLEQCRPLEEEEIG